MTLKIIFFKISKRTDIWTFAMVCLDLLTMAPIFKDFFANNMKETTKIAYMYGENEEIIESNINTEEMRIYFLKRMIENIYIHQFKKNNHPILEKLYKMLNSHYPNVMFILNVCKYVFSSFYKNNFIEMLQRKPRTETKFKCSSWNDFFY